MNPRLKSSQKWTSFPTEFIQQINAVVNENFQKLSPDGKFSIDGRIFPKEVLFKISHQAKNSITQNSIWVSVDYDAKKDNVNIALNLAIDCGGSLMVHHFENPKDEFPRSWAPMDFNKTEVFICLDTQNDDLEAQADALLGESSEESLVHISESMEEE
ncbi:MAG: hypothetical protein HOO06_10570 [Bdellovibrionaceae bacterium]|nr:hypothetical protein [Pseudobdellovibrionaceae bacterium]